MTSEQLARLRVDVGEDGDTGEKSFLVRPEDLERLLEEREKLLAALKHATSRFPSCADWQTGLDAIAFAEEAAP